MAKYWKNLCYLDTLMNSRLTFEMHVQEQLGTLKKKRINILRCLADVELGANE